MLAVGTAFTDDVKEIMKLETCWERIIFDIVRGRMSPLRIAELLNMAGSLTPDARSIRPILDSEKTRVSILRVEVNWDWAGVDNPVTVQRTSFSSILAEFGNNNTMAASEET
jgi:hypothetical protein